MKACTVHEVFKIARFTDAPFISAIIHCRGVSEKKTFLVLPPAEDI
jgi:hypothetical protein